MRTKPLVILGAFVSSWICFSVFFWVFEAPHPFLAATLLAPFATLILSLPLIVMIESHQSFRKRPTLAVLMTMIIALLGSLIWPYLYLAIPILLPLIVFLAIFHRGGELAIDMENVTTCPNELLLKSFKNAGISNGDRFTIFVEVEKRGLIKDLEIKPNTVIFEIINRTPSFVPFGIFIAGMFVSYCLGDDYFIPYGFLVFLASILILLANMLGIRSHKLIVTNSNVIVKKTIFFLITTSRKEIPITAHKDNAGFYFSTLLVCSSYMGGVGLEALLTFKKITPNDKPITCRISDGIKHPLSAIPMRRPLVQSKIPLCKSQMLTLMDMIPQNLSKLLLLREVPFFYEYMPSGDPIFDTPQSPPDDGNSRSIHYEQFSLIRPAIKTLDFEYFCGTFTLPSILTKGALDFYDHNWLRILFYAQTGSVPPELLAQGFASLAKQGFNPTTNSSSGDYIFSTDTLPKKNKSKVVFGTKGISLIGENNSLIKSQDYNEIKIPEATSYEAFFEFNLAGKLVKIPNDGSLPFKQLIKLGR